MAFRSLWDFITELERNHELVRVKEFVSPHLEMTEIADRFSKSGGKALLFENTGTQFPVLINAMGSEKRMNIALGTDNLDEVGAEIEQLLYKFTESHPSFLSKLSILPSLSKVASWMPKSNAGKGKCQEVVMKTPDLRQLPVLTCWPFDGGPFITLPVVHTKHPETGKRNVGMYRMQVFGPDLTGMHWHLHKNSAAHYRRYREKGQKMPVVVTLGGDPAYTYAATAPLPENVDEYLLAGFLRKKRVELVKCLTCELEVPEDVDFVIEGYVDPSEELILEGPFGDHTGFYSLADYYPKFHVTCITRRKDAVYPATIVGIPPQEDAWIGLATERIFLSPIRLTMVPEIVDMAMPPEGVFHNIVIVKIKSSYQGQSQKVMHSLWGAGQMMFNKIMIVTDEDIDIHNYQQVAGILQRNVILPDDIIFSKGPVDVLDHSGITYAYGSKLGIDATIKSGSLKSLPDFRTDWSSVDSDLDEHCKIDDRLLHKGLGFLIVGVEKMTEHAVQLYHQKIAVKLGAEHLKAVLYVDKQALSLPVSDLIWLIANNLEPSRDCFFPGGGAVHLLAVDGTSKSKKYDGFGRQWPNVLVMDDEVIQNIDQRWSSLGLGTFLGSPSLKYKCLEKGKGAVAEEF